MFAVDYQQLWRGQDPKPQLVPNEAASALHKGDFKEMTDAFVELFQSVIKDLEQLPNGLGRLKQILSSLLLPKKSGGVVNLVRPGLYMEAKTVRDVFMNIFPLVNPISHQLLEMLTRLSGCVLATEKMTSFVQLRQTKNQAVLCTNEWLVRSTCNDLNTLVSADATASHSEPLDQLQSSHPHILAELPSLTSIADTVRVTARIDAIQLSLSAYDSIVTAICGFFLLPKSVLVYVGHTARPLTLCWCVLKEVSAYMEHVSVKANSELLLAEQGITNIMVGDWLNYKCLSKMV